MSAGPLVDVAVNIFAKPYQTSLSVLSLLKFSGRHIDRVYLQFEPVGSMYDPVPSYVIAEHLGAKAVVYQPEYWLELAAADFARLGDPRYRLSVRYQHAFEHTDKKYLFIMHNDVLIKKDIIGAMLKAIDGAFAIGQLGQCWLCPAADAGSVRDAGLGEEPCTSATYRSFHTDHDGLCGLYKAARRRGVFVRPYWEGWDMHYKETAWPLPECRVNEWGCLVDVEQTRPHVVPWGTILPFGAFEQCGTICLDTAVAWFRELNRLGLFARHMDIAPYLTHWVGSGKKSEYAYSKGEGKARTILENHFPAFVQWCREHCKAMFPD